MNKEGPDLDRRAVLKGAGALATGKVLKYLSGIVLATANISEVLAQVNRLPFADQLHWFQENFAENGPLWPRILVAQFSDEELMGVFHKMATIAATMNDRAFTGDKDVITYRSAMREIERRGEYRPLVISIDTGDGKLHDIGQGTLIVHREKLYFKTPIHVVNEIRRAPDLVAAFSRLPLDVKDNSQPDIAVAKFTRLPGGISGAMEVPSDMHPGSVWGQMSNVIGFQSDGGLINYGGLVLPLPTPKMRDRIISIIGLGAADNPFTRGVGGAILVPRFFAQEDSAGQVRSGGRSGSTLMSLSPSHGHLVPVANLASISTGQQLSDSQAGDFSVGFVTHPDALFRTLEIAQASTKSALNPVLVRKGLWMIAPRAYIRSV